MIEKISFVILNLFIGFYFILSLQWYSYKISRIIFHYAKFSWHFYFILLPYGLFLLSFFLKNYFIFCIGIILPFAYGVYLYKNLDKKLVFTARVKRYLLCLVFFSAVFSNWYFFALEALFCTLFVSFLIEFIIAYNFKRKAKRKLEQCRDLKIILITASFGKTSIKNFLFELLKDNYLCHKTPRSVNTLMGIVKDINDNLNKDVRIYIVEAGARKDNDILEIAKFLDPQIVLVGEIGLSHLEYFKNKENIRLAKLKALHSKRLEKAFLHSTTLHGNKFYDLSLIDVKANLQGLEFCVNIDGKIYDFSTKLLGAFNAQNLALCILVAYYLKIDIKNIQENIKKLQSVEHRLQIISKEPKFIIDDGFNGNFNGMSESYRLCKTYNGRRVLVTPGIVEVSKEENIKLCEIINECFDFVIITSEINSDVLNKYIKIEHLYLKDKNKLIQTLAQYTKEKDLILFSNDAPSFL